VIRRVAYIALVLTAAVGPPAHASDAITHCAFGGPAGTARVLRLVLPEGSDFLTVGLSGTHASRPAGTTASWHLATGVFVVDEATMRLASYRIASEGTATRRTVVESDGTRSADIVTPGPDTPFRHTTLAPAPGLAPGSYVVVAFGSDGSATAPNDGWGGFVEVAGIHDCSILPGGAIVDLNHADFSGGTQVATTGLMHMDGATLTRDLAGDVVVGLMDASTQLAGTATLDYSLAGGVTGTVDDSIIPFLAPGGSFAWTAHVTGVAPTISIVALSVGLA
jgi:hypothetical protein